MTKGQRTRSSLSLWNGHTGPCSVIRIGTWGRIPSEICFSRYTLPGRKAVEKTYSPHLCWLQGYGSPSKRTKKTMNHQIRLGALAKPLQTLWASEMPLPSRPSLPPNCSERPRRAQKLQGFCQTKPVSSVTTKHKSDFTPNSESSSFSMRNLANSPFKKIRCGNKHLSTLMYASTLSYTFIKMLQLGPNATEDAIQLTASPTNNWRNQEREKVKQRKSRRES